MPPYLANNFFYILIEILDYDTLKFSAEGYTVRTVGQAYKYYVLKLCPVQHTVSYCLFIKIENSQLLLLHRVCPSTAMNPIMIIIDKGSLYQMFSFLYKRYHGLCSYSYSSHASSELWELSPVLLQCRSPPLFPSVAE